MSRIKSSDTSIEVSLRKALWHDGIRYRKNYKQLPGTPDIAITKHKIAIFCDGEFWHGKGWPKKKDSFRSNSEYWRTKIERNMARDCEKDKQLQNLGWTVMRFWGKDIEEDVGSCVEDVKDTIIQTMVEASELRKEPPPEQFS